jgi:hypothetical protein
MKTTITLDSAEEGMETSAASEGDTESIASPHPLGPQTPLPALNPPAPSTRYSVLVSGG